MDRWIGEQMDRSQIDRSIGGQRERGDRQLDGHETRDKSKNMKKRKSNKDGWFLDEQEIKNMLKLENKIKKFLPLKIKIYNNHQRLQRNLFKSLL